MEHSSDPARRMIILGCGYIGAALAERAVAAGFVVEALTRNAAKAARLRSALGLRVVEGDLAAGDWTTQLDPTGAVVVNCVSSGGGGVEGYRRSYLEGMERVVAWLDGRAPALLLYTGSTSVYPGSGGEWLDEASPTAASTPLNEVLLETEVRVRAAVETGRLPRAVVLRLAGIYGPGRHYLLDTLREGARELPGHGDYHLNLIHRDDVASAILAATDAAPDGFSCWNLADGAPATKETIARWTAEALGLPPPVFRPDVVTERMRRRTLSDGRPPDRRISRAAFSQACDWTPAYPDFRAGYEALIAETA